MKPPLFDYLKPSSLEEAARLLTEHRDDCKILAGGQTLIPMMNFRLAGAAIIIDINGIPNLDYITVDEQGLELGALARWHQIVSSPVVAKENPLLAEAVSHVAHYQIRNKGTWAGSSAHADPAAEFPAIALICEAEFTLASERGKRTVPAEEFFLGALTTALEEDEILVSVRFPPWPEGRRWAFEEFSMRTGDFALAGIAAIIDETAEDSATYRLVCFGTGDCQKRLEEAESILNSEGLSSSSISKAARKAAQEIEAQDDGHASAEYRRALVEVLVNRVVCKAAGVKGEQ